jgi:hypothetical protein
MKSYIKIFIISLVIVTVIGIFIAQTYMPDKKYTDKYGANELYSQVANSFSTDGGVKILDNDVILEFIDEKPDYLKDNIVVKANNAKNINEIGIFRVEENRSNEMKNIVDKYVSNLQKSYRAMDYFPEEIEKIDFATVKNFGNYVIYSFLNEKDTDAFYKAIENTLKE